VFPAAAFGNTVVVVVVGDDVEVLRRGIVAVASSPVAPDTVTVELPVGIVLLDGSIATESRLPYESGASPMKCLKRADSIVQKFFPTSQPLFLQGSARLVVKVPQLVLKPASGADR